MAGGNPAFKTICLRYNQYLRTMIHIIKMRRKKLMNHLLLQLLLLHNTVPLVIVVALRSCSRVFTLFSYSISVLFFFCNHSIFHWVEVGLFSFVFPPRLALRCGWLFVILFTRVSVVGFWLLLLSVHGWVVHICFSLLPCNNLVLIHGSVVLAFYIPWSSVALRFSVVVCTLRVLCFILSSIVLVYVYLV